MPGRNSPLFSAILAAACFFCACEEDAKEPTSSKTPQRDDYTHPNELRVGEDGLTYRNDETAPYTGAVTIRDEDWNMRYFAYYQDGLIHGPEIKFWEDGKIRRNFDYEKGKKNRHREWFENGNPKRDGTFQGEKSIGPHQTWFEDGSPRWSGNFVGDLQWNGHVVDHAPGGKIMWDAIFDHGRFVSGIYPESEQENLIKGGMLKPEDALYPRKPAEE